MAPSQQAIPYHLASAQIHPASPSPSLLSDAAISLSAKANPTTRVLSSATQQFYHHNQVSNRFSPTTSPLTATSTINSNNQAAIYRSSLDLATNSRSRSSSRFQNQQQLDHSHHLERPIWRSSVGSSSISINSGRTLKAAPITASRQQSIRLLQRKSEIPIAPVAVAAATTQTGGSRNSISHLRGNHHNNHKPLSGLRTPSLAATETAASSNNFHSTRKQLITSSSKTSSSSSSSSSSSLANRPISATTNSRLRQGALYARRHQYYQPSSSLLSTSGGSCCQLVQTHPVTAATGAAYTRRSLQKQDDLINTDQATGSNGSNSSSRNKSKNLSGKFNLTSSTSSLSVAVVKRARSQAANQSSGLNSVSNSLLGLTSNSLVGVNKSVKRSMLTASSPLNPLSSNCNGHLIATGVHLRSHQPNHQSTSYQLTDPTTSNQINSLEAHRPIGERGSTIIAATSNTNLTRQNNINNIDNNCGGASSAASSICDNAISNVPGKNLNPNVSAVRAISKSTRETLHLTSTDTTNQTLENPRGDIIDKKVIANKITQQLVPRTNNYSCINDNNTNTNSSSSNNKNNPPQERKLSDLTNLQMLLGSPIVSESLSPPSVSPPESLITTSIPDIPIRTDQISDHYDLEARPFARGKFAQVKRCIDKSSKQCFAAKCIKKRSRLTDIRHDILLEIEALKLSYYSGHIVKLYEVYETSNEMILVLEMAKGGELQRIIDDEEIIPERLVKRMVKQILEGLIQLHDNNIAHLDIKPQNVLLTQTYPDGDIKLCDFGISRRITKECEIREICGTPDYVAPEILRYDPISLATDMWSLGVLTYVLLSGYSPFGSENKQQTFCNITQAPLEFPREIFDKISKEAIDFMKKIIVREPSERLTSRQAINHIWLR